MAERWWDDAACKGANPELFVPAQGYLGQEYEAKKVCATCPVIDACLDEAIRCGWTGIWGGTNKRQRDQLRRSRDRV